jgi:hypothetical protein
MKIYTFILDGQTMSVKADKLHTALYRLCHTSDERLGMSIQLLNIKQSTEFDICTE